MIVDRGTPVLLKVSCLEKPRSSKVRTWELLGVSHWDRGLSCVVVVAIGVCVVETRNGLATGAGVNFFCRQARTMQPMIAGDDTFSPAITLPRVHVGYEN